MNKHTLRTPSVGQKAAMSYQARRSQYQTRGAVPPFTILLIVTFAVVIVYNLIVLFR